MNLKSPISDLLGPSVFPSDLILRRWSHSGIEPLNYYWEQMSKILVFLISRYSTPIDIWSVGCIFAEIVTKRALFDGESETD